MLRGPIIAIFACCIFLACDRRPESTNANAANPRTSAGSQPPSRPIEATQSALRDFVVRPDLRDEADPDTHLRIISAGPNITEIACALGLREQLVGRTRYCTHPPGIEQVPSIGALTDASVETVLGLHADVMLIPGASRDLVQRFGGFPIRIESLADTSIDDLFRSIDRLGELTRRPRSAAALREAVQAQLADVRRAHAKDLAVRYLLVTGTLSDPPSPPFVAGPGSFYAGLLSTVGHHNVMPDDARAFGSASLEYIVAVDPDVIIELDPDGSARPAGAADALAAWRKVGNLKAVAAGRVHVLTGPEHYLMGPRIATTFDQLCAALAPR